MNKYTIGEYVKIKTSFDEIESERLNYAKEMLSFKGHVLKVRNYECDSRTTIYTLSDCQANDKNINGDGYWLWDEKWLEDPEPIIPIEIDEKELIGMFR